MTEEMRRTEILLEGIRSDFRVVAEGHQDLRREMQEMRTELKGEIKDANDSIRFVAKALKEEIKESNNSIKGLEITLKNVAKELSDKIDKVDYKLDTHIRQPA